MQESDCRLEAWNFDFLEFFCVFFYCVIIRKHLKKLTETILYQPSRDKLYSFSRYHLLLFWTRSAVGLRVLRVYTLYPPQRSKVGSWHIHDKLGTHHCNKTTIHICVIKRLWISYGKEKKNKNENRLIFIWIWTAWNCHQRALLFVHLWFVSFVFIRTSSSGWKDRNFLPRIWNKHSITWQNEGRKTILFFGRDAFCLFFFFYADAFFCFYHADWEWMMTEQRHKTVKC